MSAGPGASIRDAPPDRGSWEAVVIGAGPAGAITARELAGRGLSVLLVDRQRFPRPKVCGCCLAAGALDELAETGLGGLVAACGGTALHTVRIGVRGRVRDLSLHGGRALSRSRLDAALVAAARDAGTRCCLGVRARPGPAGADGRRLWLEVDGDEIALEAAMIVAADGVGSPFLRGARELDGAPDPGQKVAAPVTVGVGTVLHDTSGPVEGVVTMAVAPAGYVGMVRLEDGALDVAAALRRERLAESPPGELVADVLCRSGVARGTGIDPERLRQATWSGTPALRRRSDVLTAERVVAVGDAAGYWEPFTGEGIAWALRSGRETAGVVADLAGRWDPARAASWSRRARAARRRRQRHCRLVAAVMARPRLAAAALGVLERRPGLLSWLLPGQRLLSTVASAGRRAEEARA